MSRPPASVEQAIAIVPAWGLAPTAVAPLGTGLINDTFAVDTAEGAFVLQRVHPVFAPEIHLDIAAVTEHLAAKGLATPRLRYATDGAAWVERDGAVWRLMSREPGVSFDAVAEPAQAHAAAELLGRFHSALVDLPSPLVGSRRGVHDTPAHLRRLRQAVDEHPDHRLHEPVAALAARIVDQAGTLPALGDLPERIVHGDPKISNVLFESAEGPGRTRARCWIDLDTIAPMPLTHELGDAWRSWCNPRGEDEHEATFDLEIFRASLEGYREGCCLALTPSERRSLLWGVEWITLELAARFATDALLERYFGWDRTRYSAAGEHNLVRAQGQWSLHLAVSATRPVREEALRQALGPL